MAQPKSNLEPAMTRRLLCEETWRTAPMRVIDGGARWGAETHWDVYGDQLELFAFEPAEDECRRLMATVEQGPGKIRFACEPLALSRMSGRSTINVARFPDSSSLFPNNDALVRRFAMASYLEQTGAIEVATTSVDAFAERYDFEYIDFMKLDVEGAELAVLRGAEHALDHSLLGLSVEVWFHEEHRGRPLFSDIDAYLRRFGFVLFDLRELNRWRRKTLPGESYYSWTGSGQLMYAQALYLRDLPAHVDSARNRYPVLSSTAILKLASIAEVLGYSDFALEVIESGQRMGLLRPEEANPLIDDLRRQVPGAASDGWQRTMRGALRAAIPAVARQRLKRFVQGLIAE